MACQGALNTAVLWISESQDKVAHKVTGKMWKQSEQERQSDQFKRGRGRNPKVKRVELKQEAARHKTT